jgi:predicted CxxxxCH...CXXCH cytochrome family protein
MRWLLLLGLMGCDDTLFGIPRAGTEAPLAEGFCGVRDIFDAHCVSCHGPGGLGELDLRTDPAGAIVGVASTIDPGALLVSPGQPDASLLLLKLEHTQGAGQGGPMPPGPQLDADALALIREWILDDAPETCDEPGDTDPPDGLVPHPEGWAQPEMHGLHAKLQDLECTVCHGADLTGDLGVSCDSCHVEGWRTDCTYCHGGTVDDSGAPPRDIDGSTDDLTFPAHQQHLNTTDKHAAFACETCHAVPTDVLTPGHIFVADDTPARAELDFTEGLSDRATWTATTGTCSGAYCHGDGQGHNGTVTVDAAPMRCSSCHPDRTSSRDTIERMSGEHEEHVAKEGLGCHECHAATTADSTRILDVAVHVDGSVQVVMPSGVTRSGSTCTGSCHGEPHEAEPW